MDKLIELLPLPEWMSNYTIPADGFEHDEDVMLDDRMHDYARANMEPLLAENERMKNMALMQAARASAAEREIEALRAEVERLRQLVNGGRGPLPAGAVAWLDMSPGEASLAFDKKSDSNRANKRRVMELFHRVSAGYYPLYLEPQADRAERLAEALREAADMLLADYPETAKRLRALLPTAAQDDK